MVNNLPPRSQYPSRPALWHPGRMGAEYSDDGRFEESPEMRGRPWTINRALTELCGIPGRTFFVAAEDNGRLTCFTTPFGSSQLDHGVFFDKEAFMNEVYRVQQVPANIQPIDQSELGFGPGMMSISVPETSRTRTRDRRQYSKTLVEGYDDVARRSKKRPRAASRQRGISSARQDKMPMAAMEPKKGIRIGDSDAVYAFYDHRLRCCQQNACKIIAKAWVKAVAPKKQSIHPYTGGLATRPDWWPEKYYIMEKDTWEDIRHKEPDHLNKDERVYLLCHILRMLVEPMKSRHPALQKVDLNLKGLEAVSYDALSPWFNDKDAPANAEKKLLLKEIFRVARQEANFKDGGLDGNTEVFVQAVSSDEANNELDSDDEEACGQILTPASSVEPSEVQMVMPPQVQVHEHGETFAGNGFAENVPIRTPHYTNPGFEPELSERSSYLEAPSLGNHAPNYGHSHLGLSEMYPSSQERRSSVFNSPMTPVMYSPWQSSNPPGNAPIYGFQSQPHCVQAFGGQMAQDQSYAASSLDGLPRPGAEAHHGNIFASRSVGQDAIHHQSGYQNFVTDNVKAEGGEPPSPPQ
ncbi:hypothetical protein EV127DRAFT_72353 [Xylaria flabelliformis]|nr:hypothetical protein EV127DRAFT_72353 [Xylaria flabelliformis]